MMSVGWRVYEAAIAAAIALDEGDLISERPKDPI